MVPPHELSPCKDEVNVPPRVISPPTDEVNVPSHELHPCTYAKHLPPYMLGKAPYLKPIIEIPFVPYLFLLLASLSSNVCIIRHTNKNSSISNDEFNIFVIL